jgi:hypothetical protein
MGGNIDPGRLAWFRFAPVELIVEVAPSQPYHYKESDYRTQQPDGIL